MRNSLSTVAVLCLIGMLGAQGRWVQRSSSSNPRYTPPAMVFDSKRGVIVLSLVSKFVIRSPSAPQETWEWNGTAWTARLPTTLIPTGVIHSAIAFDAVRGVTVLYGGGRAFLPPIVSATGVTLEWDGRDWKRFLISNPIRSEHAMAFDPVAKKTVMFGGWGRDTSSVLVGLRNSTWTWDGNNWTQLQPLARPGSRQNHAMVYDSARKRIVLFGGQGQFGELADTWEWDGTNWTQIYPTTNPGARQGHAMAYDSKLGLTILFGGFSAKNKYLADTWAWDGKDWRFIATIGKPAARTDAAMVYDSTRNQLILYGGDNGGWLRDTWQFVPGPGPSYTTFGAGCAGVRGKPFLSTRLGQLPIAGREFTVQINNMPLVGPAWMFLGFSKDFYGRLRLPLDLTPIGMTGCSLLVSGDLLFPVPNILGLGLWTVKLPIDLAGKTFYNQGIVFDAKANALGLILSNGGQANVGG